MVPMSDKTGATGVKWQVADSDVATARYYNGSKAPADVRHGLPGVCTPYSPCITHS